MRSFSYLNHYVWFSLYLITIMDLLPSYYDQILNMIPHTYIWSIFECTPKASPNGFSYGSIQTFDPGKAMKKGSQIGRGGSLKNCWPTNMYLNEIMNIICVYIYICKDNYIIYICHIHIIRYIFPNIYIYMYRCPKRCNYPFSKPKASFGGRFSKKLLRATKSTCFFSHGFGCWASEDLMKGCNALGIFVESHFFLRNGGFGWLFCPDVTSKMLFKSCVQPPQT